MKVRIGALDYPIAEMAEEYRATDRATWGDLSGIEVDPEQSPGEAAHAIVHELIHGMCAVYRIDVKALDEEGLCAAMEGPLLALLRDNWRLMLALYRAVTRGVPIQLEPVED